MKLRIILEAQAADDLSDVMEYLEEFVDTRKGKLSNADVATLTSYLSVFNDKYRKKIAALLGTSSFTAEKMAAEIAQGALIAYVHENDVPGLDDHDEDFNFELPHHDDEVGSSSQQIEAQNTGSSSFKNERPAFPVKTGGCPPLASLPDHVNRLLPKISASALIDQGFAALTQPFIYVGDKINRIYIGESDGYHGDIMQMIPDQKEARLARNVYHGGEYDYHGGQYIPGSAIPGIVGRIGYDLTKVDKVLKFATMASFYVKNNGVGGPEDLKGALTHLLKDKYIPIDAYINLAGNISTAQEVMGGGQIEVNEQDRKRSELQAAYHVGTWPNGKRMTAQEKAALGRELGMASAPMKKHPMQQAGENAGLLVPGQRWWAPTSESKIN